MTMRAVALLLTALVFTALAPHAQAAACHCKARAASSRALDQTSTASEHAQTERLNREFRAASQAPIAPSVAPPVTPPPRAANVLPPARPAENTPQSTPRRSAFEEYRALRAAYDRQLRAYYRAFPPPQATARMQPPPASPAPISRDEARWQDATRLDPWHGYNPHDGLGNGY